MVLGKQGRVAVCIVGFHPVHSGLGYEEGCPCGVGEERAHSEGVPLLLDS